MTNDRGTEPEAWLERHGDCLYRMALLRLGDPEIAAEVVQETFLAALRSRGSFSGRSTERTWLVGILKHKLMDRLRQFGRRLEVLENDDDPGLFDDRKHWRSTPKRWALDPGRALENQEFWDVLGRCLTGLPGRLSEAFSRIEMEGQDRDSTCDDLGITPVNLSARLHRARLLLRDCLDKSWFGTIRHG